MKVRPIRAPGKLKFDVDTGLHPKQAEVFLDSTRFRVVVAGRRWGKCLAPGSMITMADGTLKAVESITAGDQVLTINEDTYAIEPKQVQHLHDNGVKETLRVETRSGKRLELTPNHPLLANNAWTEAKDLKLGDLLAVPRQSVFGTDAMPDHEVDFLAVWLAEGGHRGYTNQTRQIIDVMNAAAEQFGTEFVDTGYDRTTGLDWRWRGKTLWKNGMIDLLKRLGLRGTTAKTKTIPDCIYRLPKHQLARFLNLFVACDGSINRRSKNIWAMEVGLASEQMLRQLSELFLKFGIRGQISTKVHKACSSVTGEPFVSHRFIVSDSKSLTIFCQEIGALSKESQVQSALDAALASAGSSNSYLPISHDEFCNHLRYTPEQKGKFGGYNCKVARDLPAELREGLNSWRKQTPSRVSTRRYEALRGYSDGFFDPIADGDVVWDEIVAIKSAGEQQTYDLTVEGNHNFIANGLVTHNTNLSKNEILARARTPKQKIWYIAPTYRMAKQIMWNDLKESIPRDWIIRIHETEMSITLMNGTIIECKGADNPDTLRGVGLNFVVMDEFQDMRVETWTTIIRPTLAKDRGEALFIGTPKAYNQLYEVYALGQDPTRTAWSSYQFPTITSPFIPEEEIADARRDMDPRTFRQEFEACHLPETEVLLFDGGSKPICEVGVGEILCHVTETGEIVPCYVEAVGETGDKVITDVTLETGEVITASAHHNFKVHHDLAA